MFESAIWEAVVGIGMRWLHIGSALVAIGGTVVMMLVIWPGLNVDDAEAGDLLKRDGVLDWLDRRFGVLYYASLGGLAFSGLYQWVMLANDHARAGRLAEMLLLVKVTLAMVLFGMAWVEAVGMWQAPARVRLTWRLVVGASIVMIAGAVRYVRLSGG